MRCCCCCYCSEYDAHTHIYDVNVTAIIEMTLIPISKAEIQNQVVIVSFSSLRCYGVHFHLILLLLLRTTGVLEYWRSLSILLIIILPVCACFIGCDSKGLLKFSSYFQSYSTSPPPHVRLSTLFFHHARSCCPLS